MARWSFKRSTWTPVAVADTVGFTANGYMGLMGGSGTQVLKVSEVYLGGQATASAPSLMIVARDSTVNVGASALGTGDSNAALNPATAALALPQVPFTTVATTQPQRSASLGLLNLSYNAFGGIVRWIAPEDSELVILGNTASFGELSLSAYTGGTPGLSGSHIIYETM